MLEALRCFLKKEKVQWEDPMTAEEWTELFRLSQYHQVLPMVYETVYECESFAGCSVPAAQMIKSQMIRQVMVQSRKTEEFLHLYQKCLEAGLHPLVVKGLICRELYPEPDYRSSGDEDVLISSDEFGACSDIFLKNGMEFADPDTDPRTAGEVPYYRKNGVLHIELHKELFSSESAAYGDLNRLFEQVCERQIQTEVRNTSVYTMCHTDHLLYLILHAFKHFLHSGFGIRQVCDIVMYASAYGSEIDWEEVLDACADIHADYFAAAVFDIGERELDFDRKAAGMSADWDDLKADGTDLLEDLLAGGVFGDSSMSRKHSSNITLQAVSEDRKGHRAGTSILSSLFPDRNYMERRYTYLKKYPFLLPAAWIARIGRYRRESRKMEGNDARESISIGNRRVELMKEYRIIRSDRKKK